MATERPARGSCARRSIDSRRCWGTLRRSSTAFRASQLRMRSAVEEVDDQAENHPVDQSLPRWGRETVHHVAADENSQNRHDWHERSAEWPRQIRRLVTQRDDASAHDHEGEQSSDRDQLTKQANWKQSSHYSSDDSSKDGRQVRSLEPGMHLSENGGKHTITRLGDKHARPSPRHPHTTRSRTGKRAHTDDPSRPAERRSSLFDCHEHGVRNIELSVTGEDRKSTRLNSSH